MFPMVYSERAPLRFAHMGCGIALVYEPASHPQNHLQKHVRRLIMRPVHMLFYSLYPSAWGRVLCAMCIAGDLVFSLEPALCVHMQPGRCNTFAAVMVVRVVSCRHLGGYPRPDQSCTPLFAVLHVHSKSCNIHKSRSEDLQRSCVYCEIGYGLSSHHPCYWR